jgi:hypothetical protein
MTDKPRAFVTQDASGQVVLHDPDALEVIFAVERENCRRTMATLFAERLRYFERRIAERGLTSADAVIVILNVDDHWGELLAHALMPGHDWRSYRARGEIPYARGLAMRSGLQEMLDNLDEREGRRLRSIAGTAVLCADRGIVAVYDLAEILVDSSL